MFTTTLAEAFVGIGLAATAVFGLTDTATPDAPGAGSQGHAAGCSDNQMDAEPHRAMHGRMMRDPEMRDMHRQMMRDPEMRDMHRDHTGGMGHLHDDAAPSNNRLADEKRTA